MDRRGFTLGLCAGALAGCTTREHEVSAAPRDAVEALLMPIRKQHNLPALATTVIRDGKLATVRAVGVRKYGDPTPVTAGDLFHIGSCTKSMTATLIGLLVDEGKLKWSTPLSEVFAGLEIQPDLRSATLDQLLTHRAGLTGETAPAGKTLLDVHRFPGSPREQRAEYVRLFLRQPPARKPGTGQEYSNAGYAIAGAMAERVTGTAWEELMQKRLFQPLGIRTAGFGAMGKAGPVLQPWQHLPGKGKPQPVAPGPLSDNPPAIGPAGTVHLSMGDWARYVQVHLEGARGGNRLLKPETWRKLHTPPPGETYACGWVVLERDWGGGTVLMHNGSNTMNFAVMWLAPKRSFAVLAATNMGGEGAEQACDEVAAAMIGHYLG